MGIVANRTEPALDPETQDFATHIAMVVRNAMEDFHCEHLSDQQMKELNPIIRNAICTAIHAFKHYSHSAAAKRFVDFNVRMIPSYWEQPELTEDFIELIKYLQQPEYHDEIINQQLDALYGDMPSISIWPFFAPNQPFCGKM